MSFMFIVAFLCSCSGGFMLSREQTPALTHSSYCNLLNIPSKPYPVIEPKPYLGIYMAPMKLEQSVESCEEKYFVQVAGVINGTPAAQVGLKENDVILALNGTSVCGEPEHIIRSFKKSIERQKIDAPVGLDILRGDQRLSLSVPLTRLPTHDQPEARHPEVERCIGGDSVLEKSMRNQDAFPHYRKLISGLYERSNIVHNPGLPDEKRPHPLQLNEVTYLMRQPLAAGEVARELSHRVSVPLEEKDRNIHDLLSRAASLLDTSLSSPDTPSEISFPALLHAMEKTKDAIEDSLSGLTPDAKTLLQTKAFDPSDDEQWNRILEVSMKIDRTRLFDAFSPLLAFLTKNNLSLMKEDIIRRFGTKKGQILYEAVTPIGKVIVGGAGPNVYAEDAALILDLGGDDLYLNNAGGTRPGMPLSLVIDWGGNDRYLSRENFSQGAGLLGGGLLIDLGGNDTFISVDGSQGAGFWGLGFLYHGEGKGTFSARKFSQGTGQMGIGLMMNGKGDSRYLCALGGQGLGLFGGAGILIDDEGNDFYELGGLEPDSRDPVKATQSFGQGFGPGVRPEKDKFGVPGGIGMLIDQKGDDTYIADYFAQGASYYYGLGILDDRAGDDQYLSGRYSQGAGIHSSIGVLVDGQGNDFYHASSGVAQGVGHDFGVGFLEDDGGDDRYYGGTLVQGAATIGGLGIVADLSGKDQFSAESRGQAFADEETGMGIVIGKKQTSDVPVVSIGARKE
jgi:hypothetical protein